MTKIPALIDVLTSDKYARPFIFSVIAIIHASLLFFVAFSIKLSPSDIHDSSASVLKLFDFSVYTPPSQKIQNDITQDTVESIAENMIETDEILDQTLTTSVIQAPSDLDYLPMHKISVLPIFDEDGIKHDIVYPSIALRSNIEGFVYLELYIDSEGLVRRVTVLREEPPDRGFGEAAVKVFLNRRGTPARANGIAVAARYRYQIPFRIK